MTVKEFSEKYRKAKRIEETMCNMEMPSKMKR